MSCRQYQRMLLSREGELSPAEEAELMSHLAGCASCAREAARSSEIETAVRAMRTLPVVPGDPDGLTDRIVRAIGHPGSHVRGVHRLRSMGRIIDHASMPAMSFAAAAMLLLVVVSGLWHVAIILGEVQQLEARQSLPVSGDRPVPTVCYAVDVERAAEALGPDIVYAARSHAAGSTILLSERMVAMAREGGTSTPSYLSRWNFSPRVAEQIRSWRIDMPSMIRPVVSFRHAEGV